MTLIKVYSAFIFLLGFVYFEPSPSDWIFPLLFGGLLFTVGLNKQWLISILLLMLAPMLLSLASNPIGFRAIKFAAIDIYMFSIFLMVASLAILDSAKIESYTFNFWTYSAVITTLIGLAFYLPFFKHLIPFKNFGVGFGIRLIGLHKDPNVFGPFLIPPLLFQLQKLRIKTNWRQIGLVLCLGIGVFLSFSRAAFLNLAICLVLLSLQNLRYSEFRKRLVSYFFKPFLYISVCTLFLAVIDLFAGGTLVNFFSRRLGLQSYDQHRFAAQSKAMSTFLEHPIMGVGPGNIENYSGLSTHSTFLRFLVERGTVGFFALIIFCFLLTYIWSKNELLRHKPHIPIALFGLISNSLFIDSSHWRFIWVLLGLSVAQYTSHTTETTYP